MVLEKTNDSIAAARQLIFIDSDLNAVSRSLVSAENRQSLLLDTQLSLEDWAETLESKSDNQTLSPLEHWNLLAQIAAVSDWSPGWVAVLDAALPMGSFPEDYLDWLTQTNALIDAELTVLPPLIQDLDGAHTNLTSEYHKAADQSRALSANLEVTQIKDELPDVVHHRPVGTLILIGGILGLLVWLMGWLIQITRKSER